MCSGDCKRVGSGGVRRPVRRKLFVLLLCVGGCGSVGTAMPRVNPPSPGVNPHLDTDSVTLFRQGCTGRRQFHDPRCESYSVTVRADGRVWWEGHRFVATEGRVDDSIAATQAARLISLTRRRIQDLRGLQCAVDHTEYVQVEVGRAGVDETEVIRGCGARFRRMASSIDRVAGTRRWR